MKFNYWLLLCSLYFLQGFPSGLLVHALPPILRSAGVSIELIGFMKLLALPWVLKFLWAPYVDRFYSKSIGVHRSWILLMQILVIVSLALLSFTEFGDLDPTVLSIVFALIFLINLFSATQDIATDGLAVKMLPSNLRGFGNSVQVSGYKIGMLFGGTVILWGTDALGWSTTMAFMVFVMAFFFIPAISFNENHLVLSPNSENQKATLSSEVPNSSHWFLAQFRSFTKRPGMAYWLFVMCIYKIGDSLGSGIIKPMLVDHGLSLGSIAEITFFSNIVGVVAAVAGGGIYFRLGPKLSLLILGGFQGLFLGCFALVDKTTSYGFIVGLSMLEQAFDGMTTVALFSMMMEHCRKNHEGADYTLQACLQVMVAGVGGVTAGLFVKFAGYGWLFLTAMFITWVCLIPVARLFKRDQFSAYAEQKFH